MMSKVKNEHYVPQGYLRNFASDDGRLFVYDKFDKKSFQTNVKNVGGETHFYESKQLDDTLGVEQAMEKMLGGIESYSLPSINQVTEEVRQGTLTVLENEHRVRMTVFMVMQFVRTKDIRLTVSEANAKMVQALLECYPGGHRSEELERLLPGNADEEIRRNEHLRMILEPELIQKVARILYGLIWLLVKNSTPYSFYSSDNPVVKQGTTENHPMINSHALGAKGIQVFLPLSSDCLLWMCERSHFRERESRDGTLFPVSEVEHVFAFNQYQARDSYRQIYCERDQFDVVREMMEAFPEIADPDADRVTISGEGGTESGTED